MTILLPAEPVRTASTPPGSLLTRSASADGAASIRGARPAGDSHGLPKVRLFLAGVALGVVMFLAGGITWQPTPPQCSGCAILAPTVHNPACPTEVVAGGRVCS